MSKHWYNNGEIQVFRESAPDDTFVLGMLTLSKEKMKNREFTKEHRDKLSKAHTGLKLSEETKQKLNGKSVWNKGKTSWCKGLTKENSESIRQRSEKISKSSIGKKGTNTGKKFSQEHKKKISDARKSNPMQLSKDEITRRIQKAIETKRKNNTFNTSSVETDYNKQLREEYVGKTILRQYKDSRYPFYCDFYIVEEDLFIEINAHWTHGGRPYDQDDVSCQEQLSMWKEKAKTSQFYANAITTWTERDVKKAQTAKENKLNYKVIY